MSQIVWGAGALSYPIPEILEGVIPLMEGFGYPIYRVAMILAGLATAVLLWVLVTRTRVGMLVRAGATNPRVVAALGVDIRRLFMIVFGFGAMLAGSIGRAPCRERVWQYV